MSERLVLSDSNPTKGKAQPEEKTWGDGGEYDIGIIPPFQGPQQTDSNRVPSLMSSAVIRRSGGDEYESIYMQRLGSLGRSCCTTCAGPLVRHFYDG